MNVEDFKLKKNVESIKIHAEKKEASEVSYCGCIISKGLNKERVKLSSFEATHIAGRILDKNLNRKISLYEKLFFKKLKIQEDGNEIEVLVNINSFKKRLIATGIAENDINNALKSGVVSEDLLKNIQSKNGENERFSDSIEIKQGTSFFLVFNKLINSRQSAISQTIEKNLPDLIKNKKLSIKEIKKIIEIKSKILKKGESLLLDIPSLKAYKFIIIKDKNNKFDLLIKDKLLGKGSFGEVFSSTSVINKENVALKFETTKNDSIANEVDMLKILNKNGRHEGVQEIITDSQMKITGDNNEVKEQKIAKGRIYSHGDLSKGLAFLKMKKLLGINFSEISKMNDEKIIEVINKKVGEFSDNLSKLIEERKKMQLENKFLSSIDNKIDQFVEEYIMSLGVINDLLPEKVKEFLEKFEPFLGEIKNIDANIKELSENFLTSILCEAVKKCQTFPKISLDERKSLISNLIAGMRYIHEKGIVHGDIKPANFFWDGNEAVIADFGGSKSKTNPDVVTTTAIYAGNVSTDLQDYLNGGTSDNWMLAGQALDIRAMGLSIYEMITGLNFPWINSYTTDEVFEKMQNDLIEADIQPKIAKIIIKMFTPLNWNDSVMPDPYPLPVSEIELIELQNYFKSKKNVK